METKFLYIKGRFLFNQVIDFNYLYSLQVCIFIYHDCLLLFFLKKPLIMMQKENLKQKKERKKTHKIYTFKMPSLPM